VSVKFAAATVSSTAVSIESTVNRRPALPTFAERMDDRQGNSSGDIVNVRNR
jgi:hypothetical protein